MEINKDITKGYQNLPKDELGFDITIHEEADKDCIVCWGEGDVQCCAGEHYYTDTCYCVLLKYWKKIGNAFMVDGYEKLLANVIKLKTI
jgi:hypothetical protein